jgi:hypothetical protein
MSNFHKLGLVLMAAGLAAICGSIMLGTGQTVARSVTASVLDSLFKVSQRQLSCLSGRSPGSMCQHLSRKPAARQPKSPLRQPSVMEYSLERIVAIMIVVIAIWPTAKL